EVEADVLPRLRLKVQGLQIFRGAEAHAVPTHEHRAHVSVRRFRGAHALVGAPFRGALPRVPDLHVIPELVGALSAGSAAAVATRAGACGATVGRSAAAPAAVPCDQE